MKKITHEGFIKKCRAELAKPNASIHSVARRLKCSAVTVYRVTGGRARVLKGTSQAWMEARATEAAAAGKTTRKKQRAEGRKARARKKTAKRRASKATRKRKLKPRQPACAL